MAGSSAWALKNPIWRSLREGLVAVYAVGVLGALLQIAGGYWDVSWHVLGIVETFFTPPHTILYTGIALAFGASATGLVMRGTVFRRDPTRRRFLLGLHIALVGGILQGIAGPMDYWWHDTFGFDPFLFTPSHSLLILGIVLVGTGMAIGSVRVLRASREGTDLGRFLASPRSLRVQTLVALTILWLDLNIMVYLVTDVSGIAYTFGLGDAFVDRTGAAANVIAAGLLALNGTLILLATKRIAGGFAATTTVALLGAIVSATGNIGFRAWVLRGTPEGTGLALFIPLFLAFVIPVFLFDVALKNSHGRWAWIAAAVLVSPFAAYLDGWLSAFIWTNGRSSLPVFLAPMLVFGLLAGLLSGRFAAVLLRQPAPVRAPV